MNETYLFRLYRNDKLLFALLSLFIVFTAIGARFSHEEFPIFLFGMYSAEEKRADVYFTYEIATDGKKLDASTLGDAQRELLFTTLAHVRDLHAQQKITNDDWLKFQQWFFRYSAEHLPPHKVLQVYQLSCAYQSNGSPEIQERKTLFENGN